MAFGKRPQWLILQFWEGHVQPLFTTLWNDLINSLFCNIVDVTCGSLNYSRSNHSRSIYSISPSISEIISIKKTTRLPFSSPVCMSIFSFCLIFCLLWWYMIKFSIFWFKNKKSKRLILLSSIVSSKDLSKTSTHKEFLP